MHMPVADPGFSWGGCANSQSGCANLLFLLKTAWKWKNLDGRAGPQWRIQDFPGGGTNSQNGCANLFFSAENCMKMKEFGPPGGRVPGAPLRSATACIHFESRNHRNNLDICAKRRVPQDFLKILLIAPVENERWWILLNCLHIIFFVFVGLRFKCTCGLVNLLLYLWKQVLFKVLYENKCYFFHWNIMDCYLYNLHIPPLWVKWLFPHWFVRKNLSKKWINLYSNNRNLRCIHRNFAVNLVWEIVILFQTD